MLTKAEVTIGMSLHNKNDSLDNVLSSIKKQRTNYKYNLCFLDDASKVDPTSIIEKYFDKDQYTIKRYINSIGFENIPLKLSAAMPESTKIMIFQSSDTIWGCDNMLNNLLAPFAFSGSRWEKKNIITIPNKLKNYDIDPELYKSENFYIDLGFATNTKNLLARGHDQNKKYLFLGALNIDIFRSLLNVKKWNSDAVCDEIMKDAIEYLNIPFIEVEGLAIHQRHVNIAHNCSAINICTNPCVPRRRMIKEGITFPHKRGWYNYITKRWELEKPI